MHVTRKYFVQCGRNVTIQPVIIAIKKWTFSVLKKEYSVLGFLPQGQFIYFILFIKKCELSILLYFVNNILRTVLNYCANTALETKQKLKSYKCLLRQKQINFFHFLPEFSRQILKQLIQIGKVFHLIYNVFLINTRYNGTVDIQSNVDIDENAIGPTDGIRDTNFMDYRLCVHSNHF